MNRQLIYQDLGNGITCIDAQYVRTGLACCYLIEENGHACFVDTGTNHTTPILLELLKLKNIPVEQVDYVIPTHVHLDHAGGAGSLMQQLPNASLVTHPRGARHMVNPSRLQAGATAVYGDSEFNKHYGALVPVDEQRVTPTNDGMHLNFQGRPLELLHTLGHAKHHICIVDKSSKGVFTGDTFGVAYPELSANGRPFIFPPTTPIDFSPEDWLHSIDRIVASGSEYAYLAHFGKISDIALLADSLRHRIKQFAQLAQQFPEEETLKQKIRQHLVDDISAAGCLLNPHEISRVIALDLGILVQGLLIWLEKNS